MAYDAASEQSRNATSAEPYTLQIVRQRLIEIRFGDIDRALETPYFDAGGVVEGAVQAAPRSRPRLAIRHAYLEGEREP